MPDLQLTFFGTAASNAFPEAFCRCANCEAARAAGGPSLRARSSALVNDDLLIDLGPDILTSSFYHRRPLTNVQYCLQTHGHSDHLDPSMLLSRSPGYDVIGAPRLHYYATPATLARLEGMLQWDFPNGGVMAPGVADELNVTFHLVEPLQPFAVGPYRVIAFPANHDRTLDPVLYSIQTAARTIFYGTDTGVLSEAVWQGFHTHDLQFDVVILDHTYGPSDPGRDHMNAPQFREHLARFRAEGLLAPNARFLATHISHPRNPPHPELAALAAQHGYEIAYDGLTV